MGRTIIVALGLLIGFGAITGIAYIGFLAYEPDRAAFPVRGIDVSHHQGPIDWTQAAAGGVDFAYIKATEGATFQDPRFADNSRQAAKAGVKWGAYHFFTLCRKARDQAANYIATVPKGAPSLPPAVDLEFGGNCAARPLRKHVLAEIRELLGALEAHYGMRPVIYATSEFFERYLAGEFPDHGFWLRSIVFQPRYGTDDWLIWQFHNRGSRPGVNGPVDLNVFRFDRVAFETWVKSNGRETKLKGNLP